MQDRLILSTGADGRFGGLAIPEFVRHGLRVRGLIHNPEKAAAVREKGASEVAVGDLGDPGSLDNALKNVSDVFYIAPGFVPHETQLGLNMVEAALRAGVRRFVFSSVIHPTLELHNHSAKIPVESALYAAGSKMEFVILHPANFYQNLERAWPIVLKQAVLAEPFSKNAKITRVDYRDVAEVAAIAFKEDRLNYGTFELCAPGQLNRVEIAQIISQILDRPIQATEPSFEEWSKSLRPSNRDKSLMKKMYDFYGAHGEVGNSITLGAILNREPRTLRQFIEELAGN